MVDDAKVVDRIVDEVGLFPDEYSDVMDNVVVLDDVVNDLVDNAVDGAVDESKLFDKVVRSGRRDFFKHRTDGYWN